MKIGEIAHRTRMAEIEAWYEHHSKIFSFIASIFNAGGSPWAFTGSVAVLFWSRQFLHQGVLPLIPNDIDLMTNNINISIALCHAIGINLNSIRPPSPRTNYVHLEKSREIPFEIDLLANNSRFGYFHFSQQIDNFPVVSLSDLRSQYIRLLKDEFVETPKYLRIKSHFQTIEMILKISPELVQTSPHLTGLFLENEIPIFSL